VRKHFIDLHTAVGNQDITLPFNGMAQRLCGRDAAGVNARVLVNL
jgi:hypothetical protein